MSKRYLTALLIALALAASVAVVMLEREKQHGRREYALSAFYIPWDDASETATHVNQWGRRPREASARVYVGEDGRLYANGSRIRFLGVDIGGAACFPRREDAEKIARRLAKFGVNLVRLHGIDANWESVNIFGGYRAETTRRFDPEALDRLDYFVAKLKENGIYVNLNLLVARRFTAKDGLPPEIEKLDWKDQHALIFIDEQVRELHKEFIRNLLTHRNPYTGLTYAEDPAVAFVEIANEMGAWFWYMLTDLVSRLPPTYKAELEDLWNSYLEARYGSVARFLEQWGVKGGRAPALTSKMYWEAPDFVREAWLDFILDLEARTYTELYDFIKREVGYKGLVVGSTCFFSPLGVQARFDVVDAHAYWQHPTFPGTAWDPQNWYVVNEPMVNHPLESTVVALAGYRVYGKPFVVSEYNHPAPNTYGPEGVLFLAAYAALQDWDGIVYFAYGSLDDWDAKRLRGFFDIDQDPAKIALLIPAYTIFVRGDVEPAGTLISASLDPPLERQRLKAYDYADGYDAGLKPAMPLIYRVAVAVGAAPPGSVSPGEVRIPEEAEEGLYRSESGQVVWDARERDRGVLIVNTSRTIALAGFIGNRKFSFGTVEVEVGDTVLGGWGALALITSEEESFSSWSRMLLIAVGYETNEGMVVRDYDSKRILAVGSQRVGDLGGLRGKKITCIFRWGEVGDWGRGPTLIEALNATIKVRAAGEIEVWALDGTGARRARVPVRYEGGGAVFEIGPEYGTLWYEILRRP